MPSNNCTIAMCVDGQLRKITKVLFGRDGSYMVMVPYHSADKGILFKMPITYVSTVDKPYEVPYSDVIDAGDVEERQIKLSHHRSGLIQFSGKGVISGLDEQGRPRGIGIQSWPLDNPSPGPSFGITFLGVDDFRLASPKDTQLIETEGIVFNFNDLPPAEGNGYVLEGFYFPPQARRFVRYSGGKYSMQIVHPTGIVIDLKVAVADPADCNFPGVIGLTVRPVDVQFGDATSGYMMSSSTGNLRPNEKGELVGDGLFCAFPDGLRNLPRRDLNYIHVSSGEMK